MGTTISFYHEATIDVTEVHAALSQIVGDVNIAGIDEGSRIAPFKDESGITLDQEDYYIRFDLNHQRRSMQVFTSNYGENPLAERGVYATMISLGSDRDSQELMPKLAEHFGGVLVDEALGQDRTDDDLTLIRRASVDLSPRDEAREKLRAATGNVALYNALMNLFRSDEEKFYELSDAMHEFLSASSDPRPKA